MSDDEFESVDPADWKSYRIYMVQSVRELRKDIHEFRADIVNLKIEAAKYGLISGAIISILIAGIEFIISKLSHR